MTKQTVSKELSERRIKNANTEAKRGESKLPREAKLQICLWFAEYHTPSQISKMLQDRYGISFTRQGALKFAQRAKWSKIIRWLRKRFLNKLSHIPIYHKAIRLKRYEKVYHESMAGSLTSASQHRKVNELKLHAAIQALKAAQEEVEGKQGVKSASVINVLYPYRNKPIPNHEQANIRANNPPLRK